MSKMSLFGKQMLDMLLAATLGAAGALTYFRITRGAEETDTWLGAHILPLPWWAYLMFSVYVMLMVQRLRLRVTEIDMQFQR